MAALNRLSQRIRENFQETTRDLALISGTGSSTTYFDTSDEKLKEISQLLESRMERERLEGIKRIIAGMSKGRDMEPFFAQVVKNVVSQSIEIRKLVYIYLLRFASTNSDLVLLSINTFQKDLSDPSPLIRLMSLRVLTSIRVPVIQGIVMLGLKKLVTDRNPWVRKTVAGGLAKVYEMDPSSLPQLIALLQTLLSSPSPLTLGASLTAFLEMCPDRLDLLHPYYRHICRLIVDADEWGQVVALEVLIRYARAMLEKPEGVGAVRPSKPAESSAPKGETHEGESEDEFEGIDTDLAMLLHCIKPLFQSRNPAVVLATAKTYWYLAPAGHALVGQQLLVRPLLRLAGSSGGGRLGREEIGGLTWEVLAEMVDERPWLFEAYHSYFFLHSVDTVAVQKAKLRALCALVNPDNVTASIREFKHYIRLPEDSVAQEAVKAIGACIRSQAAVSSTGLSALMKLLKSSREALVAQSVIVLKSVILSQSISSLSLTAPKSQGLVARLAKGLDSITNPSARASVYWLVGQYAGVDSGSESEKKGLGWEGVGLWVPDVLRNAVKGFVNEATTSKLQILTLATKIMTLSPTNTQLELICRYLFQLARYDTDYDVRDRARFLNALLRGIKAEKPVNGDGDTEDVENGDQEQDTGGVILRREQVKFVVLEKRGLGHDDHGAGKDQGAGFQVGSSSRLMGKKLKGYEETPQWTDDPTDPSLRDSELDNPQPVHTPTAISSHTQNQARPNAPPAPFTSSSASSIVRRNLPIPGATASPVTTSFSPSPVDPSPAGSIVKSKFQDLDAFLNSETESEDESEMDSEEDSEVGTLPQGSGRATKVTPQLNHAPQQYDYDEDTSESEDSEDEDSEAEEDEPLYRS